MRSLIKRILKESDDFDWVRGVNSFEPGEHFDSDSICFNRDDCSCSVSINKENVIFCVDIDDWASWCGIDDNDLTYIRETLYHGPDHDGDGDYYEVDDEEFQYSHYEFTADDIGRLQNILTIVTNGREDIDDYISDNMLSLGKSLIHQPLKDMFDTLVGSYLHKTAESVDKNRWHSVVAEIHSVVNSTECDWSVNYSRYGSTELIITIPTNVFWNMQSDRLYSLSDILIKISDGLSSTSWNEIFWDEYDTSGSDISEDISDFLHNAEEYLEENEEQVKKLSELHDMMINLKFHISAGHHGRNTIMYQKLNTNDTMWVVIINYEVEMAKLKLYKDKYNRWSSSIREFEVTLDKIPEYINNYSLKL